MNMLRTIIEKSKSPRNRQLLQAELCRKSMKHFIVNFWDIVESCDFKTGWHIDCICEHLEACKKRQIKNLIINMPPRHCKSLSISVMFPSWVWLDKPGEKFLNASHSADLTIRDCVASRYIIESHKYQNMIRIDKSTGNKEWQLNSDQNQKGRYTNTKNGSRIAISVGAKKGTGEGGNFLICDDPNNTQDANSKVKLEFTNTWHDQVWSSRMNDRENDVKVMVQQRCNVNDLTGHILKKELSNVEVLILPARYEMENRIKTSLTGWIDTRTQKDEALWPEHVGDKALKELEEDLASQYVIAGQLQQRPAPKSGGMFKRVNLENYMSVAQFENLIISDQIKSSIRYWDKAGTEDGGCNTAGVLMCVTKDGRYIVSDVVKGQWSYAKREKRIKMKALNDNDEMKRYQVWVEQEPGSAGKESAQRTIKNLTGIAAKADKVSGDKVTRAQPYEAQVEIDNVFLVVGSWNKDFVEEHTMFPKGEFKDQVDAAAGAFAKLSNRKRRAGVA